MIACVTVQEKITYGFENALNYSSVTSTSTDMRTEYDVAHGSCAESSPYPTGI